MIKDTCLEPGLATTAAQILQSLDPGSSRTRLEQRCLIVGQYTQATTKHSKNRAHNNTIIATTIQNDR